MATIHWVKHLSSYKHEAPSLNLQNTNNQDLVGSICNASIHRARCEGEIGKSPETLARFCSSVVECLPATHKNLGLTLPKGGQQLEAGSGGAVL